MIIRFDSDRRCKEAEPFRSAVDTMTCEIAQANSIESLQSCLPKIRDLLSLKHVSYQGWLAAPPPAAPSLTISTFSPHWAEEYENLQVSEWDPIAKAARRSVLPIDWESVDWRTPGAKGYRLMLERHDAGFSGLTVPVHGPQGDAALVSFTTLLTGEGAWPAFRPRREAEFAMLALKLHDRVLSMTETRASEPQIRLTPKVATCLELLAQGRKPAEIGAQLGLSVHTVRKHLDRAVNDLSCQTKAQAVTRALALGLIRFQSTAMLCLYPLCLTAMGIDVLL